MSRRNNAVQIVVVAWLLVSGASVTAKDKNEELNFQMEAGWKMANSAEGPNHSSIIEYVREGDDINSWSELVTINRFAKPWGGPSPERAFDVLKAIREKECPGTTEWNVIDKNENSILYEWHAKPCLGWPEQHEIAKIIYGKNSRFLLHYAAKVYQLSPDVRTKWLKKFADAAVLSSH